MKIKLKRFISISLFIILITSNFINVIAKDELDISAWGAIAIDADTKEVLYEKNPDKMLVPASMTKIMTTYIIFEEMEAGNLTKDTLVTVSPKVAKLSRNRSYPMMVPLDSGGKYTIDQLIKLIMIPSASASCIAVAEHISGSEEAFVKRMNETANRIGMQAKFNNSHGAIVHYTTPRGMATLVSTFIDEYPEILNYTSLQGVEFNGKYYPILNELLHKRKYDGVDGFKTGTIKSARYCLASTAKKNDRRVISVVFGSENNKKRYDDSEKILDLAFKKVNNKDNSRIKTQLNIINVPKEIRKNIEYIVNIKFTDVDESYLHNGRLYVDNELVKEYKNINTINNLEMKVPLIITDSDKDKVELIYEMDTVNDGMKKSKVTIDISDKSKALFKDLDDDELEEKIMNLIDINLINGKDNGYFGYDDLTNRAEFLTVLGRLADIFNLSDISNGDSIYKDVDKTAYYNKYILWADELGLIEGFNGKFMPNDPITIEESAKILDKFLLEYDIELEEIEFEGDIDYKNLSLWAEESVLNLSNKKILYKNKEKTIRPKENISRIDLVNIADILYKNIQN